MLKPMLAGEVQDIERVRYPVDCTPKIDGIRALTFRVGMNEPVEAWSRALIAIPNRAFQRMVAQLGVEGLDGEIVAPSGADFGEVSSAIMKRDAVVPLEYWVFDHLLHPNTPYCERVARAALFTCEARERFPWLKVLEPVRVCNSAELRALEARWLLAGHEGVMVRDPQGVYKQGRSTWREGGLLKLVRRETAEAVVVGAVELMRNGNALERDQLGHAKRSGARAGLIAGGTLGALLAVTSEGVPFEIGTGMTDAQRATLWQMHLADGLCGQIVKYEHRPKGAKTKPRFPSFIELRDRRDM